MMKYDEEEWGISEIEYQKLLDIIKLGIVTTKQVENNRHMFKMGYETVDDYIQRMDRFHNYVSGLYPRRSCITQNEFVEICNFVGAQFPDIISQGFEFGKYYFVYLSHTKKNKHSGYVDFNDNGAITGKNGKCGVGVYDANLPKFVFERVRNKINSALYR